MNKIEAWLTRLDDALLWRGPLGEVLYHGRKFSVAWWGWLAGPWAPGVDHASLDFGLGVTTFRFGPLRLKFYRWHRGRRRWMNHTIR